MSLLPKCLSNSNVSNSDVNHSEVDILKPQQEAMYNQIFYRYMSLPSLKFVPRAEFSAVEVAPY